MREIAELAGRIAEIERRLAGSMRHGTVAEVDAARGRMRLDMGPSTDGGRTLSPWVPYAQIAGALKVHAPPSPGQQMTLLAPGGDLRQSVAVPLTFSDAEPSPSSADDEHVLTFGDVTITINGGSITLAVGGSTIVVDGGAITMNAGTINLN